MKITQEKINISELKSPLVIAGLGNPGQEYEGTRHNAGFDFVDALAKALGQSWMLDKKNKAEIIDFGQLILLKPLQFMNLSGQAVEKVLSQHKLRPKELGKALENADLCDRLIVVHDDLDIGIGDYRFSADSRPAGHNGVRSIIEHLKTKNFKRLRLGIRSEIKDHLDTKEFVLRRFTRDEREMLTKTIEILIKDYFVL